jgi:hypothetical protein
MVKNSCTRHVGVSVRAGQAACRGSKPAGRGGRTSVCQRGWATAACRERRPAARVGRASRRRHVRTAGRRRGVLVGSCSPSAAGVAKPYCWATARPPARGAPAAGRPSPSAACGHAGQRGVDGVWFKAFSSQARGTDFKATRK